MLRVNDFFCGAGGMGLGFKQAGFRLAGAWDFDKYAVESYGNNVSPEVKQADITQMNWNEVPYADVWTFGFPCQDVSIQGLRKGMVKGETRSGLFYEVMRLLQETEINAPTQVPRVILAENVKGVRGFLPEIQKEYEKRGYAMCYTLYNSKYWVPQNRERYFIVGVHKSIVAEFKFPEQPINIPVLSSVLETNVHEKYYLNEEKSKWILEQAIKGLKDGQKITEICIDDQGRINKEHKPKTVSPTLRSENHGNHPKVIEITENGEYKVRKTTPREYARLQGFPDEYKQVVSDSRFYKQMGNAVTVNVSKAIAEALYHFLRNVGNKSRIVKEVKKDERRKKHQPMDEAMGLRMGRRRGTYV